MIKAIIFDFFGVLVTEGFKQFGRTHFPDDETKKNESIALVNRHDMGQITSEDFYRGLAEIAGVDYQVAKAINNNEPNRELLDYIKNELKPRYKIGVLSNSGDNYLARMLEPPDQSLFDDIVLSYQHGLVKPQDEIFQLAAKRLGIKARECIFIDDSPSHCHGAKMAGMQAIWYKDFPSFKEELNKILTADADN